MRLVQLQIVAAPNNKQKKRRVDEGVGKG
jgi:hypothetical protein